MDSHKLIIGGPGTPGGWRRVAAGLAVAVVVSLFVLDVTVHLSSREEDRAAVPSPRDRSRRELYNAPASQNETPSGAVFTHWGRSDCPTGNLLVYKGIIGSGDSNNTGGAGEYLCLTDEPEWLQESSTHGLSYLYGVEYQSNSVGVTSGQDAVCAVCQSTRPNQMMIPGRISCVTGWTYEYHGYLMSSKWDEVSARNYVCVDAESQADWASGDVDGGGTLWHVRGVCGSLPCPKYKSYLITCVVCTR